MEWVWAFVHKLPLMAPLELRVSNKPYMLSTIKDEYIHTIDHIPYSKCVQEILGKTL